MERRLEGERFGDWKREGRDLHEDVSVLWSN
jgi:hypothetical protein